MRRFDFDESSIRANGYYYGSDWRTNRGSFHGRITAVVAPVGFSVVCIGGIMPDDLYVFAIINDDTEFEEKGIVQMTLNECLEMCDYYNKKYKGRFRFSPRKYSEPEINN